MSNPIPAASFISVAKAKSNPRRALLVLVAAAAFSASAALLLIKGRPHRFEERMERSTAAL